MCGIFGAVFLAPGEAVDADAALASIAHRGPDDQRIWRAPGVVLGHRRLAILDLTEGGAQPMLDAAGTVVVVFNGEIYNHHVLRRDLQRLGHTFRSRSDTEVIVEGYRAWGEAVVERLDGMFALALWDAPRRRLVLARDRAGKKPLYYCAGPSLRFASEVKALRASGLATEPDPTALPSLLAFGYTPAPRSMYRGIAQLPPASRLVVDEGGAPRIDRYWRAPFAAPAHVIGADEAAAGVRAHVEAAVERRLEADVPLGAFLSGGIDSSIVVGVMAKKLGRKVKTFSIGFSGDARYDETHFARLVARRFDTEHTEFTLEPSSFDLVEKLVALHDGPFGDSSAIPTSVVSMLTRRHVTVALTGDGGDELFCGYVRFLASEAAERIPRPLLSAAHTLMRFAPLAARERSLPARARRFFDAALLPLPERLARLSGLFVLDLPLLLRPELGLDADEPLAWSRAIVGASAGGSTLSRILDYNFETYLPYDLLVKADRSSMIHSLELRSPFLDTALVEYAARLPDRLRRRGVTTKWILKHAFADLLPREVTTRGKMGFGIPLGAWFRGDLREYLVDHLGPRARLFDWLERSYVDALVAEHLDGRADHGHRLWLLLTLEVWLRSLERREVASAA